jgi:hypothetical protein
MTQKLVIENFQKEYIVYKIECNLTHKIYIGHTCNLTSRINTHISSFKSGNLSCTSSKILTNNDYKISVLRRGIYDKNEANKSELNFINGYGTNCVNKNKPCMLTKKEYQKEYQKKYRLKLQDLRDDVTSLFIEQEYDSDSSDSSDSDESIITESESDSEESEESEMSFFSDYEIENKKSSLN